MSFPCLVGDHVLLGLCIVGPRLGGLGVARRRMRFPACQFIHAGRGGRRETYVAPDVCTGEKGKCEP